MILLVFGFGFDNISQSVSDYYKFDKITNVERVTPDNVTFPAITICASGEYRRERYVNGSVFSSRDIYIEHDNIPRIRNFLSYDNDYFYSTEKKKLLNVSGHLDFFKIHPSIKNPGLLGFLDCFRFNAITNRSVELFKASSTNDKLYFSFFDKSYKENIFKNEYFMYRMRNSFLVYIGDNYLNSFENLLGFEFELNSRHRIEILKESTEVKLPKPYNLCKEASTDKPNHQWDCLETCIFSQIAAKYNCTFPLTLFSISGLKRCDHKLYDLKIEFSEGCRKQCPLESCFSEKFTHQSDKSPRDGQTFFRFNFRDLSSLYITQIPKTDSFTFLNNIGGGLGLFMGIAFPNMIEFLQFIFEIFLILLIHKIN